LSIRKIEGLSFAASHLRGRPRLIFWTIDAYTAKPYIDG
jgi:hypothetical protein